MAKSNLLKSLENTNEHHVLEFIFTVLARLTWDEKGKEVAEEYSLLGELAYGLSYEDFVRVFSLFAGRTITFPTTEKITDIINALLFYAVKEESSETAKDNDILKSLELDVNKKETYYKIIKELDPVLKEYDFTEK